MLTLFFSYFLFYHSTMSQTSVVLFFTRIRHFTILLFYFCGLSLVVYLTFCFIVKIFLFFFVLLKRLFAFFSKILWFCLHESYWIFRQLVANVLTFLVLCTFIVVLVRFKPQALLFFYSQLKKFYGT